MAADSFELMRKIWNQLALGAALAMSAATCADTITVCLSGGCDHVTIQAAIDAADHGDVIYIAAGTYFPTTTIDTRGKAIHLLGQTAADGTRVVIDGLDTIRVLACTSGETPNTKFENLVIQHGLAIDVFPDDLGGGLYVYQSRPTVKDCVFRRNIAGNGGGVCVHLESEPIFKACQFIENRALNLGGGILNIGNSRPTVDQCFIRGNSAGINAGGINNYDGCLTDLKDTTICSNTPKQINGDWTDQGGNAIWNNCDVPEDLDGDGAIAGSDLIKLLGAWESDDPTADINNDGTVDAADLNCLLGSWNPSP